MTIENSNFRSGPLPLLSGVEKAVVSLLSITGTRHRSAIAGLRAIDGSTLIETIFQQIKDNYDRGAASMRKDRSRENWRWPSLQTQIATHNQSHELIVERAIAAACVRLGRTDWANQVPVASGLIEGPSGGRRAIDLVRRRGERHFEFIELKIASDTPLYAAIEIICYCCIWLIAKEDPPARSSILLDANHIDLRVWAPILYYASFSLSDLCAALNTGVSALGSRHGVRFSFSFEQLDPRIQHQAMPGDVELLEYLDLSVPTVGAAEAICY